MKVLFLDMDGVVNSQEDQMKGLFKTDFPVNPYLAFLVGKIQLDTDCNVVLSSSWRSDPKSVAQINKQLVPLFDITGHEPHDHTLPPGIENCQRGREIKAWLDKWNSNTLEHYIKTGEPVPPVLNESITAYAIIDDENEMLPEQQSNFFKTTWAKGITPEIADAITKHLLTN